MTQNTVSTAPGQQAILDALQAPLTIGNAGSSTGADFSGNQPTLPLIGGNFNGSGPYANYVQVAICPANPDRTNIDVENTSGVQIAVVRDDGTAITGAAPVAGSVFALDPGPNPGQQGAAWSSTTFRGRIRIFAPAALTGNSYIALFEG